MLGVGVLQGSPLLPILFLLYIATLYKALAKSPGLLIVGFVDNINLIVFSGDAQANCRRLENAWRICERWAKSRGIEFAPQKSKLIHFIHAYKLLGNKVQLSSAAVAPKESARFLGVWLDWKLRWRNYLKKIKAKIEI